MSSNPPPTSSTTVTPTGGVAGTHSGSAQGVGPPGGVSFSDQNQPVDLVTNKTQQPLRIPNVPRPTLNPPRPQIGGGVAILGAPTGATPLRAPARPLIAVPKPNTTAPQVNYAVLNNKVTVLSTTPAKAAPLPGNMPRATATTIIRPPTSFPLTMKTPSSSVPIGTPGSGTSIRLTTATPSNATSVQLVPMNIATANLRPQGATPTTVRPAGAVPSSRGPTFRPAVVSTMSDSVRVTLVQAPANASKAPPLGGGAATITSTTPTGYYKQVTITPPNPQKITAAPPIPSGPTMRIGGSGLQGASRMTVLPANAPPLQAVSLAPSSQINVPLAPGQARALTTGKIINVPTAAGVGGTPPGATPTGVTIQKAAIPVTSPRTISLPYGTATQVATIPKPVSQAIPVARVVPQPNVVTITTTVGGALPPTGQPGSVYIARTGNPVGQPVAINLSNNQTLNLSKSGSSGPPTLATPIGAKLTGVTPATTSGPRLVNMPQQPSVQHLEQAEKLTSSPSRPSILRRREGERDNVMPDTPPPRPDSRNDDAGSSSSGSTTLSATSSPGIGAGDKAGNLSGGEETPNIVTSQPSPRKKPRKQTLTSSSVRPSDQQWEDEDTEDLKRKIPKPFAHQSSDLHLPSPKTPVSHYIKNQPHMSLLNSYRHTWKSRHNHFLKHSDVRPRESPRPTVNELAGQKYIKQKINGWKIYHLTSQMGDVIDMETELTSRLSQLQKKLDKHALSEVNKDVSKIQELIKANLQRSKVIQDQVKEAKDHALELFDHKTRVSAILDKYMSKRSLKKREISKMA